MIRPATAADARGIAEVQVRSWQAAYRHVFPPDALDALDVEERASRWAENVADPHVRCWVAEEDGIVGFVTVGPSRDPDSDGELYAIYVLAEAWGRGAGPALMDAALECLATRYREAILWVLEDNPRARRFYERHGWALDCVSKRDSWLGVDVDEVRYRIGF